MRSPFRVNKGPKCAGEACPGAPARAKGCSPDFAPFNKPQPLWFPQVSKLQFLGAPSPEIKNAKMEYYLIKISGG